MAGNKYAEELDSIRWTVYGKINRVKKNNGSFTNYGYDALGNRTFKEYFNDENTANTYYVRDAQGNVLAVYSKNNDGSVKWAEQHLYGSNRLGIWKWDTIPPADAPVVVNNTPLYDSLRYGDRIYELSNHLGDVLVTISDKKIGNDSSDVVNYYFSEVISQDDYYPFGMLMPGGQYGVLRRYGFNGKENDNEVKGEGNQQDYGMRIYDPRIGRFLSTDPLTQSYPWYTPYQYAGNKPIWCIDLDGSEEALPQQQSKIPQLTNVSESTCIGCAERARIIHMRQAKANLEKLRKEYETWAANPDNLGKPLPPQFENVANQAQRTSTLQQGGYLGSAEYKLAKANYDTYGKFLPGISDVDDFAGFLKAAGEGKGDEATMYALGFLIPEVSGKMLKGPLHHIFTNKNFIRGQQWSKKFEPMFEKAGYKLDDAINKVRVLGHKGPHPDEYHQAVYDRLQSATRGLEGDAYKKAFVSTLERLQKEVSTKGTELNNLLTK